MRVTWRKPCSSGLLVPGGLYAVTAICWAIFKLHNPLPGASHVAETLLLWSPGTWRTRSFPQPSKTRRREVRRNGWLSGKGESLIKHKNVTNLKDLKRVLFWNATACKGLKGRWPPSLSSTLEYTFDRRLNGKSLRLDHFLEHKHGVVEVITLDFKETVVRKKYKISELFFEVVDN